MSNPKKLTRLIVRFLSVLVLLASLAFVYTLVVQLDILDNPEALQEVIGRNRLMGAFLFLGLQVFQVVIAPIPGGVITVVGMLAFGPILGFFMDYVGILMGSWLLFVLVRRFGRSAIHFILKEEQLAQYEERFLGHHFQRFMILIMLAPIGPADITVMLASLSKMTRRKMLAILAICRPVSIISYSLLWFYGGQLSHLFLP